MNHPYLHRSIEKRNTFRDSAVAAAMLAAIWALDHFTAQSVDVSIVCFLPIVYAARKIGRYGALVTGVIAVAPDYFDQALLVRTHLELPAVAAINMVMRLLVYLFVAEVTFRLAEYSGTLAQDRDRLNALNTELKSTREELSTTYSRLEEDLRAASVLQESVLAFAPPTVPGCQVGSVVKYAESIGGDYVDVRERDGRIHVCVADISGKGIPAALLTTLLEHLVKDAVERGLSPTNLVSGIHSVVCQRFPSERFVTLF